MKTRIAFNKTWLLALVIVLTGFTACDKGYDYDMFNPDSRSDFFSDPNAKITCQGRWAFSSNNLYLDFVYKNYSNHTELPIISSDQSASTDGVMTLMKDSIAFNDIASSVLLPILIGVISDHVADSIDWMPTKWGIIDEKPYICSYTEVGTGENIIYNTIAEKPYEFSAYIDDMTINARLGMSGQGICVFNKNTRTIVVNFLLSTLQATGFPEGFLKDSGKEWPIDWMCWEDYGLLQFSATY